MIHTIFNRKVIVVIIAIMVGLLHFVSGPNYRGPCPDFVNGYLIDILLPFAMYLVLGVANQSILNIRISRALFVFSIGFVTETLQYFGMPIFGRTFDVLDYLMFGIGIGLAFLFENKLLLKIPIEKSSQHDNKSLINKIM